MADRSPPRSDIRKMYELITNAPPKYHSQPWISFEDEQLLMLADGACSQMQIAAKLGRSVNAIRDRLYQLRSSTSDDDDGLKLLTKRQANRIAQAIVDDPPQNFLVRKWANLQPLQLPQNTDLYCYRYFLAGPLALDPIASIIVSELRLCRSKIRIRVQRLARHKDFCDIENIGLVIDEGGMNHVEAICRDTIDRYGYDIPYEILPCSIERYALKHFLRYLEHNRVDTTEIPNDIRSSIQNEFGHSLRELYDWEAWSNA